MQRQIKAAGDKNVGPGPAFSPIRAVMDASSTLGYGIGDAILHPSHLNPLSRGNSAIDIFRDPKRHVSPGDALRQRGALNVIPTKYGLRATAAFVGNVALDPTTYGTAGGATALRTAGKAASEELAAKALAGKVTMADVAKMHAAVATERAAVPRAVSVGFQVPFTRGKVIPLVESQAIPQALERVAAKIPQGIRDSYKRGISANLTPHAGEDRVIHAISTGVRGAANTSKRQITDAATSFQHELDKAIKSVDGLTQEQSYRLVSTAKELPPELVPGVVPKPLLPFVEQLRTHLTNFDTAETAAGITKGRQRHYLPHVLLNDKQKAKFEQQFGATSASTLDNPFFVKNRAFQTVQHGEALGYKFELNPAKLIEIRGHASVDALAKKAIDDSVAELRGLKRPPKALPEVGPAAVAASDARAQLAALVQRAPTAGAQLDVRAARQVAVQARQTLAAARRTGDPAAVADAQAALDNAVQAATGQSAEVFSLEHAAPEVQQAIRKADRAVGNAEKRLARAQKQGSTRVINNARNELTRATQTQTTARDALVKARASYVGTPREVAAQTRRVLTSDKRLARAEREAEKVRAANAALASQPGTPLGLDEWKALGDEWTTYPSKYLKGVKIDQPTQRALTRAYEQITPTVTTRAGLAQITKTAYTVTAHWKALALTSPDFHVRNAIDDSMRFHWGGGRNPKSIIDADRVLTGKGKNFRLKVDGEMVDGEGLAKLLRAHGVIDQGFAGHEVAAGLDATASTIKRAGQKVSVPGTGRVATAFRKFGDRRENAFRAGLFIERIKAGDSAVEAARVTQEFLMNYGDVGRLVETARKFWLPFVTYSAKALPLVGRQFLRHPGTFANINKAMTAVNQAGGNPDLSLLPVGSRSSFAVPLPSALRAALGAKPNEPLLYNPEKVFSFGTLNTFDPTQIQREGAGLVNPFAKAAYEIPTNYRLYYAGSAAQRVRAPYAVQQAARVPGVGSLLNFGNKKYSYGNQNVPGYGATPDYLLRLFPPFSQQAGLVPAEGSPSIGPAVGSWLSGVRLSPLDLKRAQYYASKGK